MSFCNPPVVLCFRKVNVVNVKANNYCRCWKYCECCKGFKCFIYNIYIYLGTTPHPVTVTTRIIMFLVGDPYKPSFVTVTGRGVDRIYIYPILYMNVGYSKYHKCCCLFLLSPHAWSEKKAKDSRGGAFPCHFG